MRRSEVGLLMFLGASLLSLVAGVIFFLQAGGSFTPVEQATGTLASYLYVGDVQYCVTYDFATRAGVVEQFTDRDDCSGQPRTARFGEQVEVVYDPANPRRTAQMKTAWDSAGRGLTVGIIASVVFVGMGLTSYWGLGLRERRAGGL